jgi:hypothetical protein
MRKIYLSFNLILAVLVLILSSCSENEEDIAAPSIIIVQPIANDTIHLTNGTVTIKVTAMDRVIINDMEMEVISKTGTVLFTYDNDYIDNQSYTCNENFYPTGITETTQMSLSVTFENEFKNWNTRTIIFYVKP